MRHTTTAKATAALLCALLAWPTAQASSVVRMEFAEVADSAELIFEGRVESVEARQTSTSSIHTYVRFRVLDVLKGDYAAGEIELRYFGGRVGNVQLQVTDAPTPEPGETGFYFVESMQREFVHPLTGWAQGHYLIMQDEQGEARVRTADRRPISAIDVQRPEPSRRQQELSDGRAGGVELQALGDGSEPAMRPEDFRSLVRDLVANGDRPR